MSEHASVERPALARRRVWVLPVLLAAFLALFMQGSRGLYESTEGRYSECAREMAASGSLLEPVLNGEPHWTKPPLTYWAIEAGVAVLGRNPWGVRLYLAAAFVLTVIAVHLLEGSMRGERVSGYAALFYAVAPYTVGGANIASTDTLLTLWEAWAMAFYWLAVRRRKPVFIIGMWTALALAFATKGPVGLFPLVAIIPANRLFRRREEGGVALWHPLGLISFALIGLSWYVYVVASHSEVLRAWFMEELVGRTMFDAHGRLSSKPHKLLSVYLPIVLLGAGPWLPFVLYRYRANLRRGLVKHLVSIPGKGPAFLFLLLSMVVPLVVFSASTSRLPLYLLPIFPPMAVALSWAVTRLRDNGGLRHRTILRIALATAVVVCGAKAVSAYESSWKNMTELSQLVARNRGEEGVLTFFRAPLNGLSFHLGHPLPALYIGGSVTQNELMSEIQRTGAMVPMSPVVNGEAIPVADKDGQRLFHLPEGTDVIVRRKDVSKFGPLLDGYAWHVVAETRHWKLLRLDETMDIPVDATA